MDEINKPLIQNDTSSPASRKRLGEILGVLKRHKLTQGMTPAKLREILEDLGPTYVKLGQIMSMRSDMLPEVYCRELTAAHRSQTPPLFHHLFSH
ncbi:MAG: hypothetical protein QM793_14105 [Muricomes sp.]